MDVKVSDKLRPETAPDRGRPQTGKRYTLMYVQWRSSIPEEKKALLTEEMETDNCHAQRSDISNKHFSRVYNAVAEVVVAARSKCEGGLELLTSM